MTVLIDWSKNEFLKYIKDLESQLSVEDEFVRITVSDAGSIDRLVNMRIAIANALDPKILEVDCWDVASKDPKMFLFYSRLKNSLYMASEGFQFFTKTYHFGSACFKNIDFKPVKEEVKEDEGFKIVLRDNAKSFCVVKDSVTGDKNLFVRFDDGVVTYEKVAEGGLIPKECIAPLHPHGLSNEWNKQVLKRATNVEFQEEEAKRNEIKERYDLIPGEVLREVALVFGHGAVKYGERNWEKSRLTGDKSPINHALKHINNYMAGIKDDESDDLNIHLSHAIVNLMFELHYNKKGM